MRRVAPGFYDRPRLNQLTGKPSAPNYRAIIDAVARRDHARMLVDGMTAANDLGLSDAVPGRITIHTDTRIKPIHLGNQTIVFRPTAVTKLRWAGQPAMRVVQALHWLKAKLESPDDRRRIQHRLDALLNDPVHGSLVRRDIEAGLSTLPLWMQTFIQELPSMQASSPHDRTKRKPSKVRSRTSKP